MTPARALTIGLVALVVVAGAAVGIILGTRGPSTPPAPATTAVAAPTTTTDTHLAAFQDALDGEGINVDAEVATQWAQAACTGTTVNAAAVALDTGVLANKFTIPDGQQENIAEAALDFYCPQPAGG